MRAITIKPLSSTVLTPFAPLTILMTGTQNKVAREEGAATRSSPWTERP